LGFLSVFGGVFFVVLSIVLQSLTPFLSPLSLVDGGCLRVVWDMFGLGAVERVKRPFVGARRTWQRFGAVDMDWARFGEFHCFFFGVAELYCGNGRLLLFVVFNPCGDEFSGLCAGESGFEVCVVGINVFAQIAVHALFLSLPPVLFGGLGSGYDFVVSLSCEVFFVVCGKFSERFDAVFGVLGVCGFRDLANPVFVFN
jgi:hypothetical protein